MNTKLFINGSFIETKNKNKIINPANAEVIAEVSVASKEEIGSALDSSRKAFDQGGWPKIPLKERKEFILKISQGILEEAQELARLETLNTGKPIKESTFMDIPSSAKTFQYIAEHLEKFLVTESPELEAEAEAKLVREPMGVVVLIVPWNYPLLIASWKLASALAAGNTVILKPSSLTPLTALELGKIIHDVGLPEGAVNIVNGSGDQVGKELCSDQRVDMISFTGSNSVGKNILGYASENVKKTIMELGGKSASLIFKDADLNVAVNSALCSVFLNQGQMCTAMSRILVEDDIYDEFLADFCAKTKRIKLGDGLNYEAQMGPLICAAQRRRVADCVEKAQKEGAKVACGGKIPDDPLLQAGFFFEPTIITNATSNMGIFKEEVFGPVVSIHKFSNPDEAVRLANESDFGLAASIWSRDSLKTQDIAKRLNAGTVWINTYGMFYNEVPFGGFKQSGYGKELGKEGFLEYTRLKNILVDKTRDAKPLVNYWYGF